MELRQEPRMPAISGRSIHRYKIDLCRVYRRICRAIANNLSGQYMNYLLLWNWAPLGKNDSFRILHPKERVGSMIQWSVLRSHRSVTRWIHVQRGFDRLLIWKWICLKGTPQIRYPDPDSPKGTHPKFHRLSLPWKNVLLRNCANSDARTWRH